MPKDCTAKLQRCALSLLIYRRWEQYGQGRESAEQGAGSGRAGCGKWEFLTPLSSPTFRGLYLYYQGHPHEKGMLVVKLNLTPKGRPHYLGMVQSNLI